MPSDDIVVFEIHRDSACADCGGELGRGQLLRLERERPLCLTCADLAQLVFLPSGDTALTRRASKHSKLRAVVVRFSRVPKRSERQGVLVDDDALTAKRLATDAIDLARGFRQLTASGPPAYRNWAFTAPGLP